jgi:hypothetical protein
MTEALSSSLALAGDNSTDDSRLSGLYLREEKACGGYLAARKAMTHAAALLASHRRLADEQPKRVDYRQAFYRALESFNDATRRTEIAYTRYLNAQVRTDTCWTATEGRFKGERAA